jgi:hypothetical protein
MNTRFTLDGSGALEQRLECLCAQTVERVRAIIPESAIEAVLLGGGYGRGEGGVLKTENGDQPYNDLEFYLFLRGSRLLNERRFGQDLEKLSEELSPEAGLHLEFKIASSREFQRAQPAMFSYDLIMGRRLLRGSDSFLDRAAQHRDPAQIPAEEATRLLMNRGSGLIFAREKLLRPEFGPQEADFVRRNIAKAKLALGDAVLAAEGRYHWSCRERAGLLAKLKGDHPCGPEVQRRHIEGVSFKLRPTSGFSPREALMDEHQEVARLAEQVWLWLENRRLGAAYHNSVEYALSPDNKLPGRSMLRNFLVNLRHSKGRFIGPGCWRYPRERLFHSLAILLWNQEKLSDDRLLRRVQEALQTSESDFRSLSKAHWKLWSQFG